MREKTDKDGPVPIFKPAPNIGEVHGAILPGVQISGEQSPFPNSDIEALKRRECRIFLYSRADYESVYAAATPYHTEVCMEVLYFGTETDSKTGTKKPLFTFRVTGPQNSAT